MRARLRATLRRLDELHDAFFVGRWRSALRRETRRQEEALLALLFLEAFGIESPASYHTLELRPELIESFHRWHQRQGIERFPDGVCC